MLLLGGSVPDDADGLHRHRLLDGLVIGMPSDHGHAMLWAPTPASNTPVHPVVVTLREIVGGLPTTRRRPQVCALW